MLLSARPLKDVSDVNSFQHDLQLAWTQGDALDVYFQLIDASLDRPDQGFNPGGRRFCPADGATLSVVLENLDDEKKITRAATQPFEGDSSIWKLTINATDKIRGTPHMRLTLTEGAVVTRGKASMLFRIHSQENI